VYVLLLEEAADDGFDYYNWSEIIWLKQETARVVASSRQLGKSRLSTDASDHDYYNDFHPLVKNGTATSVLLT